MGGFVEAAPLSSAISGGSAAFYTSIPSGYAATPSSATTTGGSGTPTDIVDIRVPLPSGSFTARTGDSYSVRELFGSPDAAMMRVALRGEGGGRLVLRGEDVTGRTDFDPLDYNELQFVAGAEGSAQELVAVARKGTRQADGSWTGIADSDPVQITAMVTGTRSLQAAAALRTEPGAGDSDADFIGLAQDAAVFAAFGSRTAPTLSSSGNITLKEGDTVAVHDLFTTSGKTQAALYRVALRTDASAPGGMLLLNGEDVTRRIDFTPEEFVNLQFVAGPQGSAQDILVVARAGTRLEDGSWSNIVDSPATAITAAVTGLRSANAAPALRTETDPADADAAFLAIAREAAIFAPLGSRAAPGLSAAGDITVKEGDSLSLRDLFPSGGKTEAARFRVALRDDPGGPSGGRLVLNGQDVTGRTDFSPVEFMALQYVAGPAGSAQDILVVARAGTEDGAGGLTAMADSPPALIRAEVTGRRSLNTAEALRTPADPAAEDADFLAVASDAALHAPLGGQVAPGLHTVGNFTAAEGDRFALRDLFTSPYDPKAEVSVYRVALRAEDTTSGARLVLDGVDVTRRVDFTPEEFRSLQFVAGRTGSAQDILVVARGTSASGLALDSRAVQVTARSTGERSVNALPALRDMAEEDPFARIAQDAAAYAPLGDQKAPSLAAVGDFTARAGDLFSVTSLFGGGATVFAEGMTYHVAVRSDPGGTGGGKLLLNGVDVTGRSAFTGEEFAALVFVAGPEGSAQDVMVSARRSNPDGRITESPATEITARTTGTRSINALSALRTEDETESAFERVVRDAAIYDSASAPRLSSAVGPASPNLSAQAMAAAVGAYRASASTASAARTLDLSGLFAGMTGSSQTAAAAPAEVQELASLIALLGGGGLGGVRTTGLDPEKLTALALNARA
jgi:hypothetical protein